MIDIKCKECDGVGQLLVVNRGRWPGLSSTIAVKCPYCHGTGENSPYWFPCEKRS